jgi:hypothetical protein
MTIFPDRQVRERLSNRDLFERICSVTEICQRLADNRINGDNGNYLRAINSLKDQLDYLSTRVSLLEESWLDQLQFAFRNYCAFIASHPVSIESLRQIIEKIRQQFSEITNH